MSHRFGRPRSVDANAPAQEQAGNDPCVFCSEMPSGASGHAGLALQVKKIPPTARGHMRLACTFCGKGWARRRVDAKTFEWMRLAD